MAKQTQQQRLVDALVKMGGRENHSPRNSKYREVKTPRGGSFFLGRNGACRYDSKGRSSQSVGMNAEKILALAEGGKKCNAMLTHEEVDAATANAAGNVPHSTVPQGDEGPIPASVVAQTPVEVLRSISPEEERAAERGVQLPPEPQDVLVPARYVNDRCLFYPNPEMEAGEGGQVFLVDHDRDGDGTVEIKWNDQEGRGFGRVFDVSELIHVRTSDPDVLEHAREPQISGCEGSRREDMSGLANPGGDEGYDPNPPTEIGGEG